MQPNISLSRLLLPGLVNVLAVGLWTQEPADRPADALVGRLGAVDALVERRLAELAGES